jgi:hypothetical protein
MSLKLSSLSVGNTWRVKEPDASEAGLTTHLNYIKPSKCASPVGSGHKQDGSRAGVGSRTSDVPLASLMRPWHVLTVLYVPLFVSFRNPYDG